MTCEAVNAVRVPVCGGEIAVTDVGTGPGPATLMLHGLGGSRATWDHLIGPLACSRRVIAADLPGNGQSASADGDVSLGTQANRMRDLLVALGEQRVVLVGHSWGGGVAMQFAYQFPERVAAMVLIGTGGLGTELGVMLRAAVLPGSDTVLAGLAQLPGWLTVRAMPLLSRIPSCVSRSDIEPVRAALTGLRDPARRRTFIATARTVITWKGQAICAADRLSTLAAIPILSVWGSDDQIIPPQQQKTIRTHLPHAQLAEIAGAGHFPQESHPAPTLAAIQGFLRTLDLPGEAAALA